MPNILLNNDRGRTELTKVTVDDDTPKGGFRLILVTQDSGWERAVRVYNASNTQWSEVKCGDVSGKVSKTNPKIKFSDMYIKFNAADIKLVYYKPEKFGMWIDVGALIIKPTDFASYDGKTYYVYWSNDVAKYFENPVNQLRADKLL